MAGAPALDRAVHDLHAPLTVIRGLCAALERCERPAQRRRAAARIDAEVGRLAHGLAGLVAAPPAAPPAGADLAALARTAARRFAAAGAPHGIRVRMLGAPPHLPVEGDPDLLGRALDNLLGNALRHAGAGGTVTIRAQAVGDRAEVGVRDGGRGVASADRERIFAPGVRGHGAVGEGRGLGLAIARDIAEAAGGTLTLDPAGPGACFRLRLPLAGAAADDPAAA